jgi:hypothetical protein
MKNDWSEQNSTKNKVCDKKQPENQLLQFIKVHIGTSGNNEDIMQKLYRENQKPNYVYGYE